MSTGTWWQRTPRKPGRAVLILVLELIAVGIGVYALAARLYPDTVSITANAVVVGLLAIDALRLFAGMVGRRPER